MTATRQLVRLKVALDDVEPRVERWLVVPLKIRLDRLHQTLQAAMGWTDTHLWEIRARDIGWSIPDPEDSFGDPPLDARKTTLQDVIAETGAKTLSYLYDFGDGWTHTIKIDPPKTDPAILDAPFLVEAWGRCPPEDCGGPWGYAELLEALADPKHESREEAAERLPANYDPNAVPLRRLQDAVSTLAQNWAPKPRKPR